MGDDIDNQGNDSTPDCVENSAIPDQPSSDFQRSAIAQAFPNKDRSQANIDKARLELQVKEQLEGLVALADRESLELSLKGLIDRVLTKSTPLMRVKVAQCFWIALSGQTWGKALDDAGILWATLTGLRANYPAFNALLHAVEPIATEACKRRRLKQADLRAFDGIERFTKDGRTYREYSDRLAELLIKGDDPAKYAPQTVQASQSTGAAGPLAIQINVSLPQTADKSATTQTVVIEQKPQAAE